jgi:hypothetical protein
MAGFSGIAAAGKSIERLLGAAFDAEQPVPGELTRAVLARTADFDPAVAATAIGSPALSILVYRIDFSKTMRAAWSSVSTHDGISHLALELHLLLTPWADSAEFEQRILGRAMQALEETPVLSGPLLDPSGSWTPGESVQVVLEDISTEAVMRTFDSMPADYRLSVPYVARIVRLDSRSLQAPMVTTAVLGITPGGAA